MEDPIISLLPLDGEAYLYPHFLSSVEADAYFDGLLDLPWEEDKVIIFGKTFVTARKTIWMGEPDKVYTYSGISRIPLPWDQQIIELKEKIERVTGAFYNTCLLNYYPNGKAAMGWHSDDESTLVEGASIASLSLGAARKFSFQHKYTKEKVSLYLEHGNLLDMKGLCQKFWKHSLPKTTRNDQPRINLTFRRMK